MCTTVPRVAEIAIRTFNARRAVTGFLLALGGYAVVLGGSYVAGRIVKPGSGGFDDLAAIAVVLVLGTGLVTLACLITGIVMLVRGRRDVGAGLLAGLLIGCTAVVAVSAGWTLF
jgi:hypothetical protein